MCENCRLRLREIPAPCCQRCGFPLGTGHAPSCQECREWPGNLVWVRAVTPLESPATELVHGLKYQGWRRVGIYLGREIGRRLGRALLGVQVIVAVPTSRSRMRRRGYNQAQVIAESLGATLGRPVSAALSRGPSARSQTTVRGRQRLANVKDAFVLSPCAKAELEGRVVLLVDDVITTGATLRAAALTLSPAQPASILAVSFARRLPMAHIEGGPR